MAFLSADVVATVFKAVAAIYVYGLGGVLLYRARLLSERGISSISNALVHWFFPCLNFYAAVSVTSAAALVDLWVLVVLPIAHVALGYLAAAGVLALVPGGVSPRLRYVLMSAIAFSNSGDVPIAMLSTLGKGDTLASAAFPDETDSARVARGIGYASMYGLVWGVLVWLIVWNLLDPEIARSGSGSARGAGASTRSVASAAGGGGGGTALRSLAELKSKPEERMLDKSVADSADHHDHSPQHAPDAQAHAAAPADPDAAHAHAASDHLFDVASSPRDRVTSPRPAESQVEEPEEAAACGRLAMAARQLRRNPPLLSTLFGILCGLIPPIKHLFVPQSADDTAPLDFLAESLLSVGSAGIPVALMVIGASLARGLARMSESEPRRGEGAGGAEAEAMRLPVVLAVLFGRLLLMASISVLLAWLLIEAGAVPSNNKLLQFLMTINNVAPTASTVVIITHMRDAFPRETARIVLFQYVVALLTLPMFAAVGLLVVRD